MAIVSKDNKLLMTKRSSKISAPFAWVMPGGHIDPGETLEECAKRETFEETGIQLDDRVKVRPIIMFEIGNGMAKGTRIIKYCHILVFFKVVLNELAANIKLKLSSSEV